MNINEELRNANSQALLELHLSSILPLPNPASYASLS